MLSRNKTNRLVVHVFDREPKMVRIWGEVWWDAGTAVYPESEYDQAHRCINGLKCRKPSSR